MKHTIFFLMNRFDRSLTLARELGADPDMAYTVAAYHDTGLVAGRERHHTVSGEILAADTALRRWFDEEQIAAMRCAVSRVLARLFQYISAALGPWM